MEKDIAVNSVLRDMKMDGLISEDYSGEVRVYLEALWVAGWEYYRRYETHHNGNVSPVAYFGNDDKKLGEYPSVSEACRKLRIPRKTIDSVLSGKVRRMRNGHYFKYANK